jgi:hypothetical protein
MSAPSAGSAERPTSPMSTATMAAASMTPDHRYWSVSVASASLAQSVATRDSTSGGPAAAAAAASPAAAAPPPPGLLAAVRSSTSSLR